jgi:RNA polymerase sigma-70 factor, ECF subfamily
LENDGSGDPARLVARIHGGDASAEDEFVARYSDPLRRMLRSITPNPATVEDLHQETFAIVLCRLRRRGLNEPDLLGQFVRQTARKLLLSQGRKQRGSRMRGFDVHEADTLVDPAPGPLARVIHEEARGLVLSAIERVRPERYRQILRRYYIDEEPKEAICSDLGLSDRHFNRVLFRARRRFRAEVADDAAILFRKS